MGTDAHFQVSPEIFDCVQAQAVAGLLKDIHRVVYKPLLLCALGHCHVRRWTFCPVWGSECSGLGFHYNLNLLVHWVFLLLWRVSQSHSMSCYQHTSLLGWFQSWFPSNTMLHQTRESCFSECVSCVFSEERIEFGHTDIKHRSVDVCPSVDFSFLHIWSWSSARDHQLLGHHSNQSSSPSAAQFGQEASSKESWLFQTSSIMDNEGYMFLWIFNEADLFLNTSSDVWLDVNPFLSTKDCSFDPRAWFLLWYASSFIKMCVPFQITPIQLNLPQVNFTWSLVTSTSNTNAPELNTNCPR